MLFRYIYVLIKLPLTVDHLRPFDYLHVSMRNILKRIAALCTVIACAGKVFGKDILLNSLPCADSRAGNYRLHFGQMYKRIDENQGLVVALLHSE